MKLIVAGSRKLDVSDSFITGCLEFFNLLARHDSFDDLSVTEIVSGTASGIDTSGEYWAGIWEVPIKKFPADWDTHGKSAGYKRNLEMGQYADALLLIWDGESKGSGHMKEIMRKLNKPIYEIVLREE